MRKFTPLVLLLFVIGVLFACNRKPSDEAITKGIETKVSADP